MEGLRQRKKIVRKQRIQNAALDLFGSQGFQKTTISLIAEKADLGVGTVYNYYSSKEEILFSIIQDRSHVYVDQLVQIINDSDKDIFESASSFIDVYLKSFSIYNKTIWREVIGTAISKKLPIMTLIDKIDLIFIKKFSILLEKFQKKGVLGTNSKVRVVVSIIYNIMVASLIRYISDEKMSLKYFKKTLMEQVEIILKTSD